MQGTRVIDERVFRGDARVSLGRTERATFTVFDDALPEHLELLSVRGDRRALHLAPCLTGRISDGDRVRPVQQLGAAGESVALDERWRGRLSVGDLAVLFQFVRTPAATPRAQLPSAVQSRPLGSLDWTWNACAAAFLALALGGAGWAEYVYDPVVDVEPEQLLRFVRLMTPEPTTSPATAGPEPTEPAEPQPASAAASSATSAPRTVAPRASGPPVDPRARVAADAARAAAQADRATQAVLGEMRQATFAALTSALAQGNGDARDQLARGAMQEATAAALRETHGVQTHVGTTIAARADGDPAARNSLCGEACMAARRVQREGPEITSGAPVRERIIVPMRVETEAPIDGVGEVDAGAVAGRIRAQLGGVRSCYERALRANPELRGRLEVRFTLGETGRITRITTSGVTEAPEVGTCVAQRLRGLAFPPVQGGSVDFMFPFVLDHR
jgi:hypothetical protein